MLTTPLRHAILADPVAKIYPVPAYLPTFTLQPCRVYGARALIAGYKGNLFDLRRSSDNATMTVSGIYPNYAAIAGWAGTDSLFVAKLYDQSGSGQHLTQATQANQPAFDLTQAQNGIVPIIFDGVKGFGAKYLSGAAAVDSKNTSVLDILMPSTSTDNDVYWEFTASAAKTLQLRTVDGTAGLGSIGGGTAGTGGVATIPRTMPSTIGYSTTSGGSKFYVRGATTSDATVLGTGTSDTLNLGVSVDGIDSNSRVHRWGFIVWQGANDTDMLAAIAAVNAMFAIPTSFTSRLVIDGDSIAAGYKTPLIASPNTYLYSDGGLKSGVELFNLGKPGQTMATCYTSRVAHIGGLITSAYGTGKCVLVQQASVNDLSAGTTAAAIYTNQVFYAAYALGLGYTVGIQTPTPATTLDSGQQTVRTALIALQVANTGGADFVFSPSDNAHLSDASNATYFSDGLHLTGPGNVAMAIQYEAAINGLGASKIVLQDSMNRADTSLSTTGLGAADSGQAYVGNGRTAQILSKVAKMGATQDFPFFGANTGIAIGATGSNYIAVANFPSSGASATFLTGALSDLSNFDVDWDVLAGSAGTLFLDDNHGHNNGAGTATASFGTGDHVFRILDHGGGHVTCYIDGSQVADVTISGWAPDTGLSYSGFGVDHAHGTTDPSLVSFKSLSVRSL